MGSDRLCVSGLFTNIILFWPGQRFTLLLDKKSNTPTPSRIAQALTVSLLVFKKLPCKAG